MSSYTIQSKNLDKNKVFILQKSELEKRLDPLYYAVNIFGFLKTTKFQVKSIREVVQYTISGFGVGREDQDLTEQGYIQIRPTNLDEFGNLKFDRNVYLGEEYLESKKSNIVQKGDILFNNTNSQELVGKSAFFDLNGVYFHSNHITRVRVDETILRPKFLYILLNIYQKRKIFYTLCTNWNNQSGVGIDLLNSIKIIVPSLEIQDKVINIHQNSLAQKQKNEAAAEKLLASIDDYLLKVLGIKLPETPENTLKNRIFTTNINAVTGSRLDPFFHQKHFDALKNPISKYPTKRIKEINEEIKTGLPVRKDYRIEDGAYPYYGANGIIGYMDKYTHDGLYLVIGQDGYIGNHYVVNGKFWGSNHNWVLKLKSGYDYEYVKASLDVLKYDYLITGGVIPKLTKEALESIRIPLPPPDKQKEIADHITGIRQQAQQLKDKTSELLKKASEEIEKILLD